jgi:hypothetical protein
LPRLIEEETGDIFFKENILESMLRAGRFEQAQRYGTWLDDEAAILVAYASSEVAKGNSNTTILFDEAVKAVVNMPRTPDYNKNHWVKVFNQLLQALGQAGQFTYSDWHPFYEDPEALSIQAYWLVRAGEKGKATELLMKAVQANSIVSEELWNVSLQHITQGLARGGNCDKAKLVIQLIQKPQQLIEAMVELGRGLVTANLENEADKYFEKAVAFLHLIEYSKRSDLGELIFKAIIEAGRLHLIEDLLLKANTEEQDILLTSISHAVRQSGNCEQVRSLIKNEKGKPTSLIPGAVHLLVESLIRSNQPEEAESIIHSIALDSPGMERDTHLSQGRVARVTEGRICLSDNSYLSHSWGRTLARLAICFSQQKEHSQCTRILNMLRDSIAKDGYGDFKSWMLSDLGYGLAGIGCENEASLIFQQAEEDLVKSIWGIKNADISSHFIEALLLSGFYLRAQAFSKQIFEVVNTGDDLGSSKLRDFALAYASAGYFELAFSFIKGINVSFWIKGTLIEVTREAIKQKALTAGVQLAFSWREWFELEHWEEMLPQLARLLAEAQRFDDLRSLIPLARDKNLLYNLQTILATGLVKTDQISEAFNTLKNLDSEHIMIFLADSGPVFDRLEPGLSLRVLQDASNVTGWVRPDWLDIHKLLVTQ